MEKAGGRHGWRACWSGFLAGSLLIFHAFPTNGQGYSYSSQYSQNEQFAPSSYSQSAGQLAQGNGGSLQSESPSLDSQGSSSPGLAPPRGGGYSNDSGGGFGNAGQGSWQQQPQYGQNSYGQNSYPGPQDNQYGNPGPQQGGQYQGQIQSGPEYQQNFPPLGPSGGEYGQPYGQNQAPPSYNSNPPPYQDHRFYTGSPPVEAPAGLVLQVALQTAISTQVAKPGDYIQATVSQNVSLGGRGYIPSGAQIVGSVASAEAGRRLSRSGELGLHFDSLRMPDGRTIPLSAHLVGSLGKYTNKGTGDNDVYRGEGWGAKVGQTLIRGGLGAGLGAGLGTAVGAIAGGGRGAGTGAWSGTAIGGGVGVADMLLRKGKEVIVPAGTTMQIQLDQPAVISGGGGVSPQPYGGVY